jgi:membrane-associated phospholipid phosphatase
MTLVALSQIVVIALFVTFCVRLHCGPGATLKVVRFWLDAPFRRPLRECLLVFFGILALDGFETRRDDALTRWLGYDFSATIHALEGDFVATTQEWIGFPWLSPPLAFAYVIGFVGLLVGLTHAYDRAQDRRRLVMVTFAYAVNYLAVLPFYLFFPVKEPWAHPGSGVLPLTDLHLGPWVMELIRPMSGIDNCFPSYHVSLTTSLILIARDGDRGPLARFATVMGATVIVSTVILGFHWVIDALAGALFGIVIHYAGKRFAARFRHPP